MDDLPDQLDKRANMMRQAAAEIRSLREQVAQWECLHDGLQDVAQGLREQVAQAEHRRLREQVAQAEHRARLEGIEIMREAVEQAIDVISGLAPDDCCVDMLGDALQAVHNLDPAAILAEHTRLTNLIPPDRKIDKHSTVGDSDGDDGA